MIDFQPPMLASGWRKGEFFVPGHWVAEEKFDGHRIIVAVGSHVADLFGNKSVMGWSRSGLQRALPQHLLEELRLLPDGVYDGELCGGSGSWGVTDLDNHGSLVYNLFDVLETRDVDYKSLPYMDRKERLRDIWAKHPFRYIRWTTALLCFSIEEVRKYAQEVWDRGGEGLILKRTGSPYTPGERSKDWVKLKKLSQSVLTIVGFKPGRMGDASRIVLQDSDGIETTVKWKNYELLDLIEDGKDKLLGRRVVIEFQDKTPDGKYRHPRWDRFEDE